MMVKMDELDIILKRENGKRINEINLKGGSGEKKFEENIKGNGILIEERFGGMWERKEKKRIKWKRMVIDEWMNEEDIM